MATIRKVPAVEVEHLAVVDNYVDSCSHLTLSEFVITAARILPGTLDAGSVMNVVRRLVALNNLMNREDSRHCPSGEVCLACMSNSVAPLLRAASRAPLMEAEQLGDFIFEREAFVGVLMREA